MCDRVTCLALQTTIVSIQISAKGLIVMTHAAKSGIARILLLALVLPGTIASLPAHASGEIYKWVDTAGETHYTQLPPPEGITATEVRRAPAAESSGADAQLQQQVEAMDKRLEARDKAKSNAEMDAEIARITRENCEIAKKNLAELQQGGVKRYRTGDGKVIRLTEEDRQQRIAEANSQIQEFCK